jgi:hypothetical protein
LVPHKKRVGNGEETMFKDFWKIDPSQGESRFAQLLGIWLLICLIAFLTWHFEGARLKETDLIGANLSISDNPDAEVEIADFKRTNISCRQSKIKNKKIIRSSCHVQSKLQ